MHCTIFSRLAFTALGILGFASLPARALTFAQIKQAVQSGQVRSVESLIAWLPAEYRANHVFVFRSRAPESGAASRAFPRVILFDNDAKLVVAFSGDPGKPEFFQNVQLLEFVDAQDRFFTREIKFGAGGSAPSLNDNPTSCVRCHGTDAKPLWEGAPYWPGVYGQVHDGFEAMSPEHLSYESFLRGNGQRGRYAPFHLPTTASRVVPDLDQFAQEAAQARAVRAGATQLEARPNLRLNRALQTLNVRRVFRLWENSARFEARKFAIGWLLLECGDFASQITQEANRINSFLYFKMPEVVPDLQVTATDEASLPQYLAPHAFPLRKIGELLGMPFAKMSLSAFDLPLDTAPPPPPRTHATPVDADLMAAEAFENAAEAQSNAAFGNEGALAIHDDRGTIATPLMYLTLDRIARVSPTVRQILELPTQPYYAKATLKAALKLRYWAHKRELCDAIAQAENGAPAPGTPGGPTRPGPGTIIDVRAGTGAAGVPAVPPMSNTSATSTSSDSNDPTLPVDPLGPLEF